MQLNKILRGFAHGTPREKGNEGECAHHLRGDRDHCWNLSSNGATANVVHLDFDIHFQGHKF